MACIILAIKSLIILDFNKKNVIFFKHFRNLVEQTNRTIVFNIISVIVGESGPSNLYV